jgi:hypothetical protein
MKPSVGAIGRWSARHPWRAIAAMMTAKAMGKNRVVVYDPANPLPLTGGVSRLLHDLMPSTQVHRRSRGE